MSTRTITAVSGSVGVGILAVIAILNMTPSNQRGRARAAEDNQLEEAAAERAVSVEVTKPAQRALMRSLKMPATLLAYEAADLYAKTSGYVSQVKVDIGDRVHKGDALLIIDVPEMADQLRQAEALLAARRAKAVWAESMIDIARAEGERSKAELDLKKITLQRKEELRRGSAIPEQELDEAKSELDLADAQVKIARARVASAEADVTVAESEAVMAEASVARLKTLMDYATIRAPFDGVITDRLVDPGAFVRSAADGTTTPMLAIATADRLRLVLEIPESDASFVRVGTDVQIEIKAAGGPAIEASVARTAWALKADTRTMRAEVDLDNKGGRFASGMYAQVVVRLETKQQAMLIPSKAIRVRGRAVSVLVANGTKVESRAVELGYDDGIWVEIIDGLEGDEQVIISADSTVAPGAEVKPVAASS